MREVIGIALMNQASVSWRRKDFASTIDLYNAGAQIFARRRASENVAQIQLPFRQPDRGRRKAILKLYKASFPIIWLAATPSGKTYFAGKTDAEGILAIYTEIDEKRSSILEKQKLLESVVAEIPRFPTGHSASGDHPSPARPRKRSPCRSSSAISPFAPMIRSEIII